DASAVHPESYSVVNKMATDMGVKLDELINNTELRARVNIKQYVTESIGLPTLKDIMEELSKPGRDPRETFEVFNFQEGVNSIKDLKVGMKLPGLITNITNFGAFVDIGVHQDGLVHLSHLADKYVSDPNEVVTVNQKVEVFVLEVDTSRKRISLSMKSDPFGERPKDRKEKNQKPNRKRRVKEDEGDMAAKLALLKGKFGKS